MPTHRPTLALAMKYPDHEGNVWAWLTRVYDALAGELKSHGIGAVLAYPKLTDRPAVETPHLPRISMDLVAGTRNDPGLVRKFLTDHRVGLVMYADVEPSLVDLSVLRGCGARSVNYVHYNFPDARPPALARRIINRVRGELGIRHHDLYIAVSDANRRFLTEVAGIPARKVKLIVNGVDTQRFSPLSSDAEPSGGFRAGLISQLKLPSTTHYALIACQSRPEKRVDFLIGVAAEVFRKRPGLSLTFIYVGDGGEREKWTRQAQALGLGGRFVFAGHQPDLQPWYRLADVFLHAPSRESFGLVIVEAMSSGVPVICSKVGGPATIVLDGQTGYTLSTEDRDGFVNRLLRLVEHPQERAALGRAGRARVVEHYSMQRQVHELAEVVNSLIGASPG